MTIEVKALVVRYRRFEALRGVDLAMRRGTITAVLGPNGAGKTTLLRTLIGAQRPHAGQAMLDGESIFRAGRAHRAARLAYVAQRPLMTASLSVRETVELGRYALPPATRRIDDALARLDLLSVADRRVTTLSTGQQQRVAFARAIAQVEPDGFLVLDEPAAALDLGRVRSLVGILRAFAAGGGGVVVTVHDITLASVLADEACILNEGRVAAHGPVADVLHAERLESIFGVPFLTLVRPDAPTLLIADVGESDGDER